MLRSLQEINSGLRQRVKDAEREVAQQSKELTAFEAEVTSLTQKLQQCEKALLAWQ